MNAKANHCNPLPFRSSIKMALSIYMHVSNAQMISFLSNAMLRPQPRNLFQSNFRNFQSSSNLLSRRRASRCLRLIIHSLLFQCFHSRFPGTNTKSTTSATSISKKMLITVNALFINSFLTNGSRIGANFMNVYSLKPANARRGSTPY